MLAINGGTPYIKNDFDKYNPIQDLEIAEAVEVLKSGVLSDFLGAAGEKFLGGPRVKSLEQTAAKKFGSKYCVSFNSWTSGLNAMVGSIPDLEVGDEIITSPWTMSATATAIIQAGAIPVFADISEEEFQISPDEIVKLINSRTKAILAVDIFGRSSNYSKLRDICNQYGLMLLSDSAQAPGAKFDGRYITELSDIGGYSLNYHKHIHAGEGGFALTNNAELAERMQLIRNHAESVVTSRSSNKSKSLIGNNYRLGELEAAIAKPQVERIDQIVGSRIKAAHDLTQSLSSFPHINLPKTKSDQSNVYYILPIVYTPYDGISRDYLVEILKKEGIPGIVTKYTNIHRLQVFLDVKSSENKPHPWNTNPNSRATETYGAGSCPVAENLYENKFLGIHMCAAEFSEAELQLVTGAFHKVWRELGWIDES